MLFMLKMLLGGVGMAALAGMAGVVKVAVRRGLAPLNDVAEQATRIHADSLGARFHAEAMPDEIQPIFGRLNDLLARLQHSFERERRFSADVAHELRTPVAELRALAEVSLQSLDLDRETATAFQDAFAIAQQMQRIVTGLLALVRCESGQQTVEREPIDLRTFVEQAWKPLAKDAARKRLRVDFDLPSGTMIESDRTLRHVIVFNLLTNAVDYTPISGALTIGGKETAGRFTLEICNPTDDLKPDDVPHLFK